MGCQVPGTKRRGAEHPGSRRRKRRGCGGEGPKQGLAVRGLGLCPRNTQGLSFV